MKAITGEHTSMEKIFGSILALSYTGFTAYITSVEVFTAYAQIFMYISAGLLSLVTAFYVFRNKGRKK
jgi:hypothetical protein